MATTLIARFLADEPDGTNVTGALRVVDLYCGAGGFSEGFRQAGFDVVCAVDHSSKACRTYSLNHPNTETIVEDVMELDADDLPSDIDVLIGSPPCTEFSLAKNGGKGDVEEGLKYVNRFLHFVAELEPRYWIMENVPRLRQHLPEEVRLSSLPNFDVDGSLSLETHVLNAARYGTPQRRERLFSGRFPEPEPRPRKRVAIREVLSCLPNPHGASESSETAKDPVYRFELDVDRLTDHFYDTSFTPREAEEVRRRKEDHSFYGKMSFPDDIAEPARTVTRNNRRVGREILVLPMQDRDGSPRQYRQPTVRECASIQGFPLTYQFEGTSHPSKWEMVGDAVPPPVAYELAKAILENEGREPRRAFMGRRSSPTVDLNAEGPTRRESSKLGLNRPFRHHVPFDDMRSFRVDLETDDGDPPSHPLSRLNGSAVAHPVRFRTVLYKGYAKDVESTPFPLTSAVALLDRHRENLERSLTDALSDLFVDAIQELGSSVPDATTFQAIRARRFDGDLSRDERLIDFRTLDGVGDLVDRHLPASDFGDVIVWAPDLLEGTELPIRTLAKAVLANYVTEKLNSCGRWICENVQMAYTPEGLEPDLEVAARAGPLCGGACIDDGFKLLANRFRSDGPLSGEPETL